MIWTWGTIYTEENYREALSDSSCYNMFLRALQERMAVIGQWAWRDTWKRTFGLSDFIFTGDSALYRGYGFGSFARAKFERDWFKGFGNYNLRAGHGWVFLQATVDSLINYFVRKLDENGSAINLTNRGVLPAVGNWGVTTPVRDNLGNILYYKSQYSFPYPDGWVRKYPREIANLNAYGLSGQVARLIPPNQNNLREWGMRGWYFKKATDGWHYDPTAIRADLIESRGLIQPGDYPGPWILNNLRDALNQLTWTYSTPDFDYVFPEDLGYKSYILFSGYDKFNVRNDSGVLNDSPHSDDAGPNDPVNDNTVIQYDRGWPAIHSNYFERVRFPGIYPNEPYVVGTNTLGANTIAPADPTGALLESWPMPSYFTFSRAWRAGGDWRYDPLIYTPDSEGIPRTIEFYSKGLTPTRSVFGNSWNIDYVTGISSDESSSISNEIGVIKWNFKYRYESPNAT